MKLRYLHHLAFGEFFLLLQVVKLKLYFLLLTTQIQRYQR